MSTILQWANETDEAIDPTSIEMLKKLLQQAITWAEIDAGEVSLTFVDDNRMQELNLAYRGLDRTTDVLSFSQLEGEAEEEHISYVEADDYPDLMYGDIVISIPCALRQSIEYEHSFERELGFLFIHGFLHLIGYDHQDDAGEQAMVAAQEKILQQAGLTR